MEWLRRIPMAPFAIVVGTISVLAWIIFGGTPALVISILAGSSIALRATLGDS